MLESDQEKGGAIAAQSPIFHATVAQLDQRSN